MHMEKTKGLRKGAWTYEEDKLLGACINKYGEGKWHLVPQRAGLNRCRKSCRLRWMNYLNPNIKRGSFAEDEIDMIFRLHKLLGNRWSLIAARLPGRTANDVKNYWHTHLSKKVDYSNKEEKREKERPKETMEARHEIIKPQPRTFSSNSAWLKGKHNNFASDIGGVRECATTPVLVASKENVNVQKECDTEILLPIDGDGGDGGCGAQPCPLFAMWWESLWNVEDQVGNHEKIDSHSLLGNQEKNSLLEFPKDFFSTEDPTHSDCYLDFNLCDVDSLWDL